MDPRMNTITAAANLVRRQPASGAWLALASVYLIWGSTYLGIRIALDGYPPFLMGCLRFLAAGGLFYAFLRWRGRRRRRRRSGATRWCWVC